MTRDRVSALVFGHNGWRMAHLSPTMGLGHVCSAPPIMYRWIMDDIFFEGGVDSLRLQPARRRRSVN